MKTLRTKWTLFVLLNVVTSLYGQNIHTAEISGCITDSLQQPVLFATVALYKQADSAFIAGTITGDDGNFVLQDVRTGAYFLKISYIGFNDTCVPQITVTGEDDRISLGVISIEPSVTRLDEVVIADYRLSGKEEINKTVYTVTDQVKQVSRSGIDVLRFIPSVSVGLKEDVLLEGRPDISFYVNDVKCDKEFVAQIDPEQIEKVEVITNPSVKYAGDVSGIIKIFLKKDIQFGLGGRLNVEIPTSKNLQLFTESFNLDYGYRNFRFFVSDRFYFQRFISGNYNKTIWYDNNLTEEYQKNGEGILGSRGNRFTYGVDWFINEKNTINFYSNIRDHYNTSKDFIYRHNRWVEDVPAEYATSLDNYEDKGRSVYYSLFYKRTFDKSGRELSCQAGAYKYWADISNQSKMDVFNPDSDSLINQYVIDEGFSNNRKSLEVKTDYSDVYGKILFDGGYKLFYNVFDNSEVSPDESLQQNFKYNELRQAGYVSAGTKVKSVHLLAGLRLEHSNIQMNDTTRNNYVCLLPHLTINKKFKSGKSLKLDFRRSISRPGINQLNPFQVWYDVRHFSTGNPYLEPAYYNNLSLSFSGNIKSNYFSLKSFFNYITNDIQLVSKDSENSTIITLPENVGKSTEAGLSLTGTFRITKWMNLNSYAKLYHKTIYDNGLQDILNRKWIFELNAQSVITPYKDYNFMFVVNYSTPKITYNSTRYRDILFIVGFEKSLFKNGKLLMMYMPPYTHEYIFDKTVTETKNYYYKTESTAKVDYLFVIQFSWSFNKGKKVKKAERINDFEYEESQQVF